MILRVKASLTNFLEVTYLDKETVFSLVGAASDVDVTGFDSSASSHLSASAIAISDEIEKALRYAHGDKELTRDYSSSLMYVRDDARCRNKLPIETTDINTHKKRTDRHLC